MTTNEDISARLAAIERKTDTHIESNTSQHSKLFTLLREHQETEDEHWRLLVGNGKVGLFERVRDVEKTQAVQIRIAWIVLTAVLGVATMSVWQVVVTHGSQHVTETKK